MIKQILSETLNARPCTLIGVGPMSQNCVDVSIDLSNQHNIPIMLIASRRQIDSEEFGGGYVNSWDTHSFANYVKAKDKKGKVLLARDHGGPWQNNLEVSKNLTLKLAMESAKRSYEEDIKSGFQLIHIDPSIDIHHQPTVEEILERIYELYQFCWETSKKYKKEILFEIGTEEQSGSTNTQEELEFTLNEIEKFCSTNKMPKPTFVVIQTGTKVLEMRNVGSFDSPVRVLNEIPSEIQVPKMIEICNKHSIYMKEHNTDYLTNEALKVHPRLGIHSANVAPEFGVHESKTFLEILEKHKMKDLSKRFIQIALESKKWEKWMIKKSQATNREKALISGHYIFATRDFLDLKLKAQNRLKRKGIDLDNLLKDAVRESIVRYLIQFQLIR
tara:strand:- start:2665 stop:3828 length:1164 start_codon:yes stop_codon:yes gene_type:complete